MTSSLYGADPATGRPGPRPVPKVGEALALMIPVGCIAATVGVLTWASQPWVHGVRIEDLLTSVAFELWNLGPHLALLALLVIVARRWPGAYGVAVLASLGYAGYTAWSLYDFVTSESSTAALLFVVLPFLLWGGVITVGALSWVAHHLQKGRASRTGAT